MLRNLLNDSTLEKYRLRIISRLGRVWELMNAEKRRLSTSQQIIYYHKAPHICLEVKV
jgi:hypothetical protein